MPLFATKPEETTLEDGLRQARLSRPGKPKRRKSTVTDRGLIRATVYFSPNELEALDRLCSEYACSRSSMLRALIRCEKETAIDSPED